MPSEKYAARRGSVEDGMRMITACFARAPQRCTSRTYMHFLLMFQEVRPISKTRNQLARYRPDQLPLRLSHLCDPAVGLPRLRSPVPHGVVLGVPGYTDPGAVRDPHGRHSVAQPTEPAPGSDDGPHGAHRTRAPVHSPGSRARLCATAGDLFSVPGRGNPDVFGAGGTGETPAHGSDARVRDTEFALINRSEVQRCSDWVWCHGGVVDYPGDGHRCGWHWTC